MYSTILPVLSSPLIVTLDILLLQLNSSTLRLEPEKSINMNERTAIIWWKAALHFLKRFLAPTLFFFSLLVLIWIVKETLGTKGKLKQKRNIGSIEEPARLLNASENKFFSGNKNKQSYSSKDNKKKKLSTNTKNKDNKSLNGKISSYNGEWVYG